MEPLEELTRLERSERDRAYALILADRRKALVNLEGIGNRRELFSRQMDYAHSRAAKMYAARRVLPSTALPVLECFAESLKPGARNNEPVVWKSLPKKTGAGRRPVCILPPLLKAKQYIILDLINASASPPAHIFDAPHKGVDHAIGRVIRALEDGYDWCWAGDIRDCFQHVAPSALRHRLPLASTLVRYNLDTRSLKFVYSGGVRCSERSHKVVEVIRRTGPAGLLQGAPASNAVLAYLFADMKDALGPLDCVLCVYADNLFIAAREQHCLHAARTKIAQYIETHPAGPFRLHQEQWFEKASSINFLGYDICRCDDDIIAEPTHGSFERLYGKFVDAEEIDLLFRNRRMPRTNRLLRSYRGAYRHWREKREFLGSIEWTARDRAARLLDAPEI